METLALILTLAAYAVTDGDTLKSGGVGVRLWGIDAAEMSAPAGPAARAALGRLTGGATLRCEVRDIDRYRRIVARCALPDGRDLACEMVRAGHARDWPRYSGGAYAGCAPLRGSAANGALKSCQNWPVATMQDMPSG